MKKISKNAIVIIIIAAIAVAGLLVVYFLGKNNYEDKFFPGTTVNGWDVSGETAEEVKDDLQTEVEQYTLTINERGGTTETITGKDIGLVFSDGGEVDDILNSQDSSKWFMSLGGKNYSVGTSFTYDEQDLRRLVNKMECFKEENIIQPENALVSYQNDEFVILPEVEGNVLDKDKVFEAVEEAVTESKESIDLEEIGAYEEPSIRSTDETLNQEASDLNLMLAASLTYDFVDSQWVCDKEKVKDWIVQDSDGNYSLDRDSVYQWVTDMAYETDTFGLSHPFVTSDGVEIELEGGGDYGWCIDKDATTELLYQYIITGQVATIQPEYLYTAMDRSKYDIGDTYVEVCISTQTLWCYYEGELITTTPVITGNNSLGYDTPSGSVWAIDGKKEDWTFTHFPDSHSSYWMPFNDECGLHDATWQPDAAWGNSSYYLTSGSHGCVNMQLEPMSLIYQYMEIGYPVVVYYSTDQVVGPQPTQSNVAG